VVRLVGIEENILYIQGVDIIDGTPLLDIKPYVPEFDVDPRLYKVESVRCRDNGGEFVAVWKPIAELRAGKIPLYPEGLLDLLDKRAREAKAT